jgi:hypothetical protein
LATVPPLPKGEGRGEGEGDTLGPEQARIGLGFRGLV